MDNRFVFRCGILVVSLLSATNSSLAQAQTPRAMRSAATDSVQFRTWTFRDAPTGLYLPPSSGKPLPVVMFLHPCQNDPVHEWLWINAAVNAIEPTAVFLPTAPETPNGQNSCSDWGGTYDASRRPQMENALHEFDSLVRVHGFDPARQYLYGESMGGEGVYRLLVDFPERFAGAVSVGGYTKNTGAARMARTPFWILIGVDDEWSPIDETRAIHEAILAEGGTQVKYTEFPGLGHVAAIEQVRTDSSVVGWLLRQKRDPLATQPDRSRFPRIAPPFAQMDGTLHLSETLPPDTRLAIHDLSGTLLLETDSRTRTVRLPSDLRRQVVLWTVSHSGSTWTGKIAILP